MFSSCIVFVCQIGADGRRSQIFLAMSTAAEFRDHLSAFSDFYSSLGPPNPDNVPDDGKLKSEMMLKVCTITSCHKTPHHTCHMPPHGRSTSWLTLKASLCRLVSFYLNPQC